MGRTRRALRAALIGLLVERGWDDLSVQDICDRADVGRSTFYTHFADKEELLQAGFDDLRRELRAQRTESASKGDPLGFARGVIEHAAENQTLFRAIIGRRAGHFVEKHFRQLVVEIAKEELGQGAGAAHFVAGGLVQLLTWWVDGRRPVAEAADLEALFRRLAAPALGSR